MTFERSPDGIRNRRFFLNVDIVVYSEGRGPEDKCPDAIFWNNRIRSYKSDLRFKLIPSGGKEDIINIYLSMNNDIDGVVFAVDRDNDHLFNHITDNKCFIRTWGYSFENDLISIANIRRVIELNTGGADHEKITEDTVEHCIMRNFKALVALIRFDRLSSAEKKPGVGRERYRRFFKAKERPYDFELDKRKVLDETRRAKRDFSDNRAAFEAHAGDIVVLRDINGHLLLDIVFRIVNRILREIDQTFSYSKEQFLRHMLFAATRLHDPYFQQIQDDYYNAIVERATS